MAGEEVLFGGGGPLAVARPSADSSGKALITQQSVNAAVKSICDIMRRSNCAGAMQYVPELTWILFLRILDERETREAEEAEAVGAEYTPSLKAPYRWQDWAAPGRRLSGENSRTATLGAFFGFRQRRAASPPEGLRDSRARRPARRSSARSCPASSGLGSTPSGTSSTCSTRSHEISDENIDPTHVFTLSPGLRGPAPQDGREGQRRRPVLHAPRGHPRHGAGRRPEDRRDGLRPLLRHRRIPRPGVRAHAPARLARQRPADQIETLKRRTFYGREKENLIYPSRSPTWSSTASTSRTSGTGTH